MNAIGGFDSSNNPIYEILVVFNIAGLDQSLQIAKPNIFNTDHNKLWCWFNLSQHHDLSWCLSH